MRKTWDEYWFDLVEAAASRGTCPRRQVGALLVKSNTLLATGYNGAPSGHPQCDEVGCEMENDHCVRTIHAEVNVLIRSTPEQQNGATLYVTDYPCQRCALLISNTGISKVIFVRNYRNNNKSTDLFIKSGIQVSSADSELENLSQREGR